jgi:hypothetical protein
MMAGGLVRSAFVRHSPRDLVHSLHNHLGPASLGTGFPQSAKGDGAQSRSAANHLRRAIGIADENGREDRYHWAGWQGFGDMTRIIGPSR